MGSSGWAISVCAAACAVLLVAEVNGWKAGRAVFKTLASTAFVALAVHLGAWDSAYGRWVLVALALSWVGDVLLLSHASRWFLAGIGSFLLAHVIFAIAFATQPVSLTALGVALLLMSGVGAGVLLWLWPHLKRFYRVAVTAYVLAIVAMCSMAIGVSAATGAWLLAGAAVAFALSDVAVARNRFVAPGPINRLWGLPLYYVAQVVLALSVGGLGSPPFA